MKAALMAVAREARATGALWTTDWDRRPVPSVADEGGAAAAAAPPPAPAPQPQQQQQTWQQYQQQKQQSWQQHHQQQQQQPPSYAAAGYPPPQQSAPAPPSYSYPPQQQQHHHHVDAYLQPHATAAGAAYGGYPPAGAGAAVGTKRARPHQQQQAPFSDYPSLPHLPQQFGQQQQQPPAQLSKAAKKKAARLQQQQQQQASEAAAAARAAAALSLSSAGAAALSGDASDLMHLTPEERAKRARRAGRFGLAPGADEQEAAGPWRAPPHHGQQAAGGGGPGSRYGGHPDRWAAQASRRTAIQRALQRAASASGGDGGSAAVEDAAERFTVRGTCERLEKSYLRLTSAPNPAEVRPPRVLEAALQRCVEMAAAGPAGAGGGGGAGAGAGANANAAASPAPASSAQLPAHQQTPAALYFYLNDQLKAIRQDCTVQRLRGALAVRAYEAHARAALEYGDAGEFNQCQVQLGLLHAAALREAASAAGVGGGGGGGAAAASAGKESGGRGGGRKRGGGGGEAAADAWSDPPDASSCSVAEFAAYKVLYHAVFAKQGEAKGITGAVRSAVECWTTEKAAVGEGEEGGGAAAAAAAAAGKKKKKAAPARGGKRAAGEQKPSAAADSDGDDHHDDDDNNDDVQSLLSRLVGRPVAVALVRQGAREAAERRANAASSSSSPLPPPLPSSISSAAGAPDALLPPAVANALRARAALARDDPLSFFAAYRSAPALGRALLDLALPRVRFSALQALVRACRPGPLPIEALARMLGFHDPSAAVRRARREREQQAAAARPLPGCRAAFFDGDGDGAPTMAEACAACLEWARAHGAVLVPLDEAAATAAGDAAAAAAVAEQQQAAGGKAGGNSKRARAAAAAAAANAAEAARAAALAAIPADQMAVDTRASSAPGVLDVPEDTNKVAHGDANLNIADFLAKVFE
jgi:hypothetical protein